jgi:hypothetical protein
VVVEVVGDDISGSKEGSDDTESLVTVFFVRPNLLPTINLPVSFLCVLNGIHGGSCSTSTSIIISWQQTLHMVGDEQLRMNRRRSSSSDNAHIFFLVASLDALGRWRACQAGFNLQSASIASSLQNDEQPPRARAQLTLHETMAHDTSLIIRSDLFVASRTTVRVSCFTAVILPSRPASLIHLVSRASIATHTS